MDVGQLRYVAILCGSGITALGLALDKLPIEATGGFLGTLGLIAAADMYKHRKDK